MPPRRQAKTPSRSKPKSKSKSPPAPKEKTPKSQAPGHPALRVRVSGYTTESGKKVRGHTRHYPAPTPAAEPKRRRAGPQAPPKPPPPKARPLDAAIAIHYSFSVGPEPVKAAIGVRKVETTETRTRMVRVPRKTKSGKVMRREGKIQYAKTPTGRFKRRRQSYTITLTQILPYDLDALAKAITAGRPVIDDLISEKLPQIRQISRESYQADKNEAADLARTYRAQFIPNNRSTVDLSDAWVNELRFWFEEEDIQYEIVPFDDVATLLDEQEFDDRPSGMWWTNDNGNMFDALRYAKELSEAGLGPDYVVLTHEDDYDAVYLIKVWIKKSEKDRK